MKLYTYWRSSASFRVRIGLNLKGLDVEHACVSLLAGEQQAPEYVRLNPQGLVPTLEDGDVVLSQSLAILEYLDEKYPEPPLLPEDAAERARVRRIALMIACEIQPLANIGTRVLLTREFGMTKQDAVRWGQVVAARGLAAVEALVASDPATGRFCHGDTPTLADTCLVPQMYNARRQDVDLSPYPTLQRIDTACQALDPFAQAAPENQPDAST